MTDNPSTSPPTAAAAAKRRRNRKKKPKKKKDTSSKNSEEQEKQRLKEIEDSKMNSNVKLRNDIVSKEGYTTTQVDKAMEEMWNQNLAYDEYDQVLHYLKTGGQHHHHHHPAKAAETAPVAVSSRSVEETKEIEVEDAAPVVSDRNVDDEPMTAKEKMKNESVVAESLPTTVPKTMAAKLDMVAGFESLSDAIFAMTEWINTAAKPNELEDLCAAVKTSALPTVIERAISECKDQATFDTAILRGMVRLFDSLLKRCGISTGDATSAANLESFQSILRQSRKIALLDHAASKDIGYRVSRFLVSRIYVLLKETKAAAGTGRNGGSSLTMELQTPPSAAALPSTQFNNSVTANHDIAKVVSQQREMHKLTTKRFCAAAQSACHSLLEPTDGTNGFSTQTANGVQKQDMGTDKEDIFSAIVEEDTKNAFEQHLFMYSELKTQVKEGESENVGLLRQKVDDIQSKRASLASQITQLRESMAKLEAEDEALSGQQQTLQREIDNECDSESKEASRLNSALQEATKQLDGDESIRSLVDMLKSLDDSLASESASVVKAKVVGSDGESAEANAFKVMDAYLLRAKSYFLHESDSYRFLQSKILALQNEISALKHEIEMCDGLGMTTTINQMEQTLKSKEAVVTSYTNLVERIKTDSNSIFKDMMDRLEEYKTAQDSSKKSLPPIRAHALQGISQCISTLEVPDGDNLDAFLAINDIISIQPPPPPTPSNDTMDMADAELKKKPLNGATAAPKLTWANGNSASTKTPKTSLLDIQKQELESKVAS